MDKLSEYDLNRITSDPLNASLPSHLVAAYAEIYKMAKATTPQNFATFRQYVERMKPELQILYLWQVVKNAPPDPESRLALFRLPEYISWYENKALFDCLIDGYLTSTLTKGDRHDNAT